MPPSTSFTAAPMYGAPSTAPGVSSSAEDPAGQQPFLPSMPSMVMTPSQMAPASQPVGLPSSESMFAYPSAQMYGGPPYPSAMDGPFKFYANPPGRNDSEAARPPEIPAQNPGMTQPATNGP